MNNRAHGFHTLNGIACLGSLLALLITVPVAAQETSAKAAKPRPAKVIVVQAYNNSLVRQYPAIVFPSQETELSFRLSGRVVSLPVRASSLLRQGDVVAELDKRDLEHTVARLKSQRDQAKAQLEALIKGARAEEIAGLQAGVFAAQARVDQAREQVERTRELHRKQVAARAKLERDEAALRVVQAELRTAEEQLRIGQSGGRKEDVAAAQAFLRGLETDIQKARDNLDDATLRAPFDGRVSRRDIDNFTNVQAGQSIVLLQRLGTVHLVFDVPGADVLMWSATNYQDAEFKVELTGSDQALTPTEVVEFSTQADAGTQTYRARLSVEIPDGVVALAGMVGRVRMELPNTGVSYPAIPVTALAATPEGAAFVWVVDPQSHAVGARPVATGKMTTDLVTIVNGIEAGETIVTAGVSRLSEGLVIRPITSVGN